MEDIESKTQKTTESSIDRLITDQFVEQLAEQINIIKESMLEFEVNRWPKEIRQNTELMEVVKIMYYDVLEEAMARIAHFVIIKQTEVLKKLMGQYDKEGHYEGSFN